MTHHVQIPGTVVPTVVTPGDIAEALTLLAEPNSKPIAGGTDLLVELDRGQHQGLETLVDLTRIDGLNQIVHRPDPDGPGTISLGPLVTHNQVVASEVLGRHGAPLAQACWEVGSPQLRNRATVAGNIVTASPANDSLSALVALDAVLTLTSHDGSRQVPISQFHLGVRRTVLEPGELVTGISFPALGADSSGVFVKLGLRRAQAISVVHLAAVCHWTERDRGNGSGRRVVDIRLALGSVAPTIVRVDEAESLLTDGVLDDAAIAAAATAATAAVNPIDDLRATADYRSQLVGEMVTRALRALRDDTAILPQDPPLLWGRSDGSWPTGPEHRISHELSSPVTAAVNGSSVSQPYGGRTLLDWLRDAGHTGVKEGCAEGECGSCTVDLDGMAVLSCLVPASRASGTAITTIEGLQPGPEDEALEGDPGDEAQRRLHRLQQAFIDTGAVQCGFCIPGFLMSGAKLLEEHPTPSEAQITLGLSGNLCRCTGYYKIEDAVRVAFGEERS